MRVTWPNVEGDQVNAVSIADKPASTRSAQYEQDSIAKTASLHEPRFVRACIPEPIHAELKASDLREIEKLIVYDLVCHCGTAKSRCKTLSVEMLDKMIGERGRRRVINHLKGSPYFWRSGYSEKCCRSYGVTGFDLAERAADGTTIPTDSQSASARNTSDVGSVGGCGVWLGPVVWRVRDFGMVDHMVATAKVALGWDHAETSAHKNLKQVELVGVPESDAELFESALANIPVRPAKTKKTAEKRAKKAREKARSHVANIRLFQRDPTANIKRKAGRLYTRLTSLPKWARKTYLRYIGGLCAESADIRCCYLWCLAAQLRQKRLKRGLDIDSLNKLLDLIESGGFYEELAKRAGVKTSQAKKSFAIMCLFGDEKREHWGKNRLWFALDAMCPLICDEIAYWRRQPGGATRLSNYCQRMEGAIMLDGLLPAMEEADIPCNTIHDGCVVPLGCGETAAQVIRDRAASIFGRPCFVKVEAL